MATLLQAPESHAVLRPLLPSLGNLIHDKVERVRVAAVGLLSAIKKTPGIKYYHVVPVEHLTSRLTADPHNAVASGITALLLNSYFPSCGSEQITRCLKFLTNDPAAAAVFYNHVAAHLPTHAVVQLAVMLVQCLQSAIETDCKQQAKHKRRKGVVEEGENDDDEENLLSAADTPLMANVTETICTLWESIQGDLEHQVECYQFLLENFSGNILTDALTHFERKARNEEVRDDCHRTCAAILRLAGCLPASAVPEMMDRISVVLEKCKKSPPTAHLALFCVWGRADAVASSLAAAIESEFEGNHELLFASPEANSKKRKSGRSGRRQTMGVPHLPSELALQVVGDILRGADPSNKAARWAILESDVACLALEQALQRGTKHAERLLERDSVSTYLHRLPNEITQKSFIY